MNSEEQLQKWLEGESVHDDKGDCCPDFSCCEPTLLWPKEKREKFVKLQHDGQDRQVIGMLLESLEALMRFKAPGKKVAVVG